MLQRHQISSFLIQFSSVTYQVFVTRSLTLTLTRCGKQDQERFQKQVIGDAIHCSQFLGNVRIDKNHAITIMCHCVELGHLILRDVFYPYKAELVARKHHSGTFLQEQKHQRRCSVHYPVELVSVSSPSSEVDCKQSYKIRKMVDGILYYAKGSSTVSYIK